MEKEAYREKSRREEIWDDTVKNELAKGIKLKGRQKYLYKEAIPKEVLQLKRAQMKLEILIKQIGDNIKKESESQLSESERNRKKEENEIARLNRPLVDCMHHGLLYLKDVIKGGKSRWTGEQRYKCRQCMSDLHRKYYGRKKEYVLLKCANYRANNAEKVKESKQKYWRKKNGKNKEHEGIEG